MMVSIKVLVTNGILLLTSSLPNYCYAEESCSVDGDVILVGGPNEFEGRVEVCLGGVWRRWCHTGGIIDTQASVICRQLHNTTGFGILGLYGTGNSSSFISNVICSGNEERIIDCVYDNTTVEECNDVGVQCRDPTCRSGGVGGVRLTDAVTESEGRVELCTNGFRAGLCCDELFDVQAATVLCRELGLNTNNPGITTDMDMVSYRSTLTNYNCSGNELEFRDCRPGGARMTCSYVRLNCSKDSPVGVELPRTLCPGLTTTTSDSIFTDVSSSGSILADVSTTISSSSPLNKDGYIRVTVGVMCGVFAILLACCVVILIVVLLKRRKTQVTIKKDSTNTSYGMKSRPQERTISNSLYTNGPTSLGTFPYDATTSSSIVALKDAQSGGKLILQHRLLHSSEGGSHVYSMPISNNKSGNNMFLDTSEPESYSKLNDGCADFWLDQSLSNSNMDADQYSHIEDGYKYSKISKQNSKACYSQLNTQVSSEQFQEGSSAMPYEVRTTPVCGTSFHEVDGKFHPYSTVHPEVGDTGYSKLHVIDGSSKSSHDISVNSASIKNLDYEEELVTNNAYESHHL